VRDPTADFVTLVFIALRDDIDVWAWVKDLLVQPLRGSTPAQRDRPSRQ